MRKMVNLQGYISLLAMGLLLLLLLVWWQFTGTAQAAPLDSPAPVSASQTLEG